MRMHNPMELNFSVNGAQFAAQAWGDPKGYPVLALHGWLDNSASFFELAPRLPGVYFVALDLAGHGKSDHRLGSAAYNIWEDIAEIFSIADQLGWVEFGLLGHSRGAIIAMLAAGTFPERIRHLALIEGIFPEPSSAQDAPKILAQSIKDIQSQSGRANTFYPSLESAINARERGKFPLSYTAAKALTERGVIFTAEGFSWRTDRRLLATSAVRLLPEQTDAFIRQVMCPVMLMLADDGITKLYPTFLNALSRYPHIQKHMLGGGHHLHMESAAANVAELLVAFFVV
jgi:pimeloyl-ACP methyl ester carboxylesterase